MRDQARTDDIWLGYCIGVYEGEGTINTWTFKDNPNRVYARLVVRMTDPEPCATLQRVFGGSMKGPYLSPSEAKKGYKPKYRWTVAQIDEVLRLCRLMLPYLSARRQAQLQVALDLVEPSLRRPVQAGTRRAGVPQPQRPRRTGGLVCPAVPEPSARGYQRHRLLGIPVCDICRESFRLYYNERNRWKRAEFLTKAPEEQAAIRAKQAAYVRKSRAKRLGRLDDKTLDM